VSSGEFGTMQFVVMSGPSGVGKSTIVDRLIRESPVRLVKSVSATTRAPRKNEVDGQDYYFLSLEEFTRRRLAGEFLECAEVHTSGKWYGTLKSEIHRAAALGGWALLEIDVQGARQIVDNFPQALTIFISTPSEADFERRLRDRGTESEEAIQKRLATARAELAEAGSYRFQVVNDDLAQTLSEITRILLEWKDKA
jgi:guanylate kinase